MEIPACVVTKVCEDCFLKGLGGESKPEGIASWIRRPAMQGRRSISFARPEAFSQENIPFPDDVRGRSDSREVPRLEGPAGAVQDPDPFLACGQAATAFIATSSCLRQYISVETCHHDIVKVSQ